MWLLDKCIDGVMAIFDLLLDAFDLCLDGFGLFFSALGRCFSVVLDNLGRFLLVGGLGGAMVAGGSMYYEHLDRWWTYTFSDAHTRGLTTFDRAKVSYEELYNCKLADVNEAGILGTYKQQFHSNHALRQNLANNFAEARNGEATYRINQYNTLYEYEKRRPSRVYDSTVKVIVDMQILPSDEFGAIGLSNGDDNAVYGAHFLKCEDMAGGNFYAITDSPPETPNNHMKFAFDILSDGTLLMLAGFEDLPFFTDMTGDVVEKRKNDMGFISSSEQRMLVPIDSKYN